MSEVRPRLIILVGPKGSGKTTLGSRLSEVFPVCFFAVEPVLQENIAHPDGLTGEALVARGLQRLLAKLVEQSKLSSAIVIESNGKDLAAALDRFSRVFHVIPVCVRAPLEVCLARTGLQADTTSGPELKLDWALTFDNPNPIPTRAQVREAFAPLFSKSSSPPATFPTLTVTTESNSVSPVIVRTHEPPERGAQGEPRSCLKHKSAEPRRGVRWDEPNLQQNEDEKVPRMKIDEPKTPFHYIDAAADDDEEATAAVAIDTDSDDEPMVRPRRGSRSEGKSAAFADVDLDALASEALRRREAEWEGESEGDEFMTYKERKLEQQRQAEFEEKRKKHYNMGSLLKKNKPTIEEDDE